MRPGIGYSYTVIQNVSVHEFMQFVRFPELWFFAQFNKFLVQPEPEYSFKVIQK